MRVIAIMKSLLLQMIYKVKYHGRIDFGSGHHLFGKQCKILIKGKDSEISMDGVRLNDYALLSASEGGTLVIGKNVGINRCANIVAHKSIRIGDGCSFGPNVCIYDHDHYFDQDGFTKGKFKASPIEIGDNVWVGSNVVILRGSKIGSHSIIGAGVIVHGEISPHSLVKSCAGYNVELIKPDTN